MSSMTPAPAAASGCQVVLANNIAKKLLQEVKEDLGRLEREIKVVGFLATTDEGAKVYAEFTGRTCRENGFEYELRHVAKEDLEQAITKANEEDSVHGIMVYYPVFASQQDQYLQQIVALEKDVEGLSHKYRFNLYNNVRFLDSAQTQRSILPCTPLAIVKVLEYLTIYNPILKYGNRLFGKTITVINRSEVVGRPLAALLANDGATVYSVDLDGVQLFTRGKGIRMHQHEMHVLPEMTLKECLGKSDVVVSGVPSEKYKVNAEMLKDGATCINFSSDKNFDTKAVKDRASIFVPSIGKVTIAVLLRNLIRLAHNQVKVTETEHAGI